MEKKLLSACVLVISFATSNLVRCLCHTERKTLLDIYRCENETPLSNGFNLSQCEREKIRFLYSIGNLELFLYLLPI